MEAPSHAGVEFPVSAVRAIEGPFKFKPQAPIVTEFSREASTNIVPGVVIRLIIMDSFQSIQRGQIKGAVAGKFVEDVGFDIPRLLWIDVFPEAESKTANEAVDAVKVHSNAVVGPIVSTIDVRILELSLRLDVPRIT